MGAAGAVRLLEVGGVGPRLGGVVGLRREEHMGFTGLLRRDGGGGLVGGKQGGSTSLRVSGRQAGGSTSLWEASRGVAPALV